MMGEYREELHGGRELELYFNMPTTFLFACAEAFLPPHPLEGFVSRPLTLS
jgi:hypothetical protein